MSDKNRARTRIHGHFNGTLSSQGHDYYVATLNLSLKGLLCATEHETTLVRGDECTVTIVLSGDISLSIQGVIARIHGREVGVDITAMDESSYAHLRNIVRFSSDDPDAIDQEQAERPFS